MTYKAQLDELRLRLGTAAGLHDLLAGGLGEGIDQGLIDSVLEEAGRFAEEVLAPLNRPGDEVGVSLDDGRVTVPPGWADAYRRWCEAGWAGIGAPSQFGGQHMPQVLVTAVSELWNTACLSFSLGHVLTQGAVEALARIGTDEQKRLYVARMASGQWTGTMNLTEPHAGSDLGLLKTRAVPQGDGTYRLFGTKCFISYGEHEMTENIIHLVLARLPDAPEGTRGISMFLVPKWLVNADGSIGRRNDVRCTGIESKLGIHGSPTCVMTYGEKDGAVGTLVGEEHKGLAGMFIMMNRARLEVGVQGVSIAERATQQAMRYANERLQGRSATKRLAPIVEHADVRRMLLSMQSLTAAARAICLLTAREIDLSERGPDDAARAAAGSRLALLTPIAKAFATDIGVEVASMGIQVHGGTGFMEPTGAAQHYRDARILPIYEGTNGIQAIDLVTRKLPLEGGAVVKAYLAELGQTVRDARAVNDPRFGLMADRLGEAVAALGKASLWLGERLRAGEGDRAQAGAVPYLRLFSLTLGGCLLAKGAIAARNEASGPRAIAIARHFAESHATAANGLHDTIVTGADALLAADASLFAA
jgi:alkylation response protein AidB-like acyl-CoA dehydrogenase